MIKIVDYFNNLYELLYLRSAITSHMDPLNNNSRNAFFTEKRDERDQRIIVVSLLPPVLVLFEYGNIPH